MSCVLKMNKIIALFWNSEDDSTCMNLCHQGVLAEIEGLLILLSIRLPSLSASVLSTKQMASSGFLRRLFTATKLPGERVRAFFGAGCHSDSAEKPSPEPPPGPQSLGFAFSITEGENPYQKVVPVKERLWEKLGMVSGKRCPSNDNEKKTYLRRLATGKRPQHGAGSTYPSPSKDLVIPPATASFSCPVKGGVLPSMFYR